MMATFTRHQRRAVWVTLSVAALCIVLFLLPDSVARFRWQRDLVASEPWRLLTAQFIHLDGKHLIINLVALVALALTGHWLSERDPLAAQWPKALLGSLVMVMIGLSVSTRPVSWYAGLSGGIYGLFGALLLFALRQPGPARLPAAMLLVGFLVKLAYDLTLPPGTLGPSGIPLMTPAHAYGAFGGMLVAQALIWRRQR